MSPYQTQVKRSGNSCLLLVGERVLPLRRPLLLKLERRHLCGELQPRLLCRSPTVNAEGVAVRCGGAKRDSVVAEKVKGGR